MSREIALRRRERAKALYNTDRLLDFSTAATGTLFFIPSAELLEELGED